MEITSTSLKQRLVHSSFFAWASSLVIWASQYFLQQRVDQILSSAWVDFIQTLISSFLNASFYNELKKQIPNYINLSEEKIIGLSVLIVSILWVWAPKYIIHQIAHTKWAENIAFIYLLGNIAVMLLYEKMILQPKK